MSHRKVVLVTGASSGFGKAIAGLLAKRELEVFGTSRHPSANGSMPGVSMGPLDVRMDESVRAGVDTILDRTGHLDILVNNAGYVQGGAIEEVTLEQAKAQFETNFFGAVRMVKAVLPTMRKQASGPIINISSVAGLIAAPFLGCYNASKLALEGYTESLRHKLKPFHTCRPPVEPGRSKTNIARHRQYEHQPTADYTP